LKSGWSCDVERRGDAVELFNDKSKTMEECRQACKSSATQTSFRLGWQGCCVLSDGVCAITQGDLFKMQEADSAGHYRQKRSNTNPRASEAAGACSEVQCAHDDKCTFNSELKFKAPQNVPTGKGDVPLYFDFAHALSMPFLYIDGDLRIPNIFHFSSNHNHSKHWLKDPRRKVRVVGSIPADSDLLEDLKHVEHMISAGDDTEGKRIRKFKIGFRYSASASEKKRTGQALKGTQRDLDEICTRQRQVLNRHLTAPSITMSV